MRGNLLILSAPSGAGKTSLARALIEAVPNTEMSVSHTTRNCRPGEVDGVDYHFVSEADFLQMVDADEFLEHAQVYDHHYGTHRNAVAGKLEQGINILLDVDWQGARNVKKLMSEAISVSILPPSLTELEQRLKKRAQDSQEVIARRMAQAMAEMSHCREADHIILNDDFDAALQDLEHILRRRFDQVRKLSVDVDSMIDRQAG